jgi:hypothetical protein
MCGADDPATVGDALAMLDRALAALAGADAGSLPTAVQAEALRALERAEARRTAARAGSWRRSRPRTGMSATARAAPGRGCGGRPG